MEKKKHLSITIRPLACVPKILARPSVAWGPAASVSARSSLEMLILSPRPTEPKSSFKDRSPDHLTAHQSLRSTN